MWSCMLYAKRIIYINYTSTIFLWIGKCYLKYGKYTFLHYVGTYFDIFKHKVYGLEMP
jgi:hypothetical protein